MAHLITVQPALTNSVFAGDPDPHRDRPPDGRDVRAALALSFVWALGVWALGEGFGLLFTATASPLMGPPGGAVLDALIGVLAWPRVPARRLAGSAASEGPLGEWGGRIMWGRRVDRH